MSEEKDPKTASIQDIFLDALDISDPDERSVFLDGKCGVSTPLRQKVDALLANSVEDQFLESPAIQRAPSSLAHPDGSPFESIGRYKLLEIIGEGGMGVVYMAEQAKPVRRKVALKVIKLGMDTKQVVARFEAERQALAMMDHPHIAKILDAGTTESGRPYFVMELVRSVAIHEFCDENQLSVQDRLELFLKICRAIGHAHQKGIIHRDIKPSNVLVTLNDGEPHPMVIDFGIAKAMGQSLTEKTLFTMFSQWIGTPVYMSPEQTVMSKQDVDTRADVYALGILLYELLTGAPPFPKERFASADFAEMQHIIQKEEPCRPSTSLGLLGDGVRSVAMNRGLEPVVFQKSLRGDLDWIILKAIEKNRNRRYESVSDLAKDIRRHLNHEPVAARPPTLLYRVQKEWNRNKVMYSAACLVFLSLFIGLTVSLWQTHVATEAKSIAETATARETELRTAAEENALKQRMIAYASDMSLAQRYLDENDVSKVRELLDRYVPEEGEGDIRGIYWTHLSGAITDNALKTFPHETMVRSISFSDDGTRLVSQTLSGRVRLFDTRQQIKLQEFGGGVMTYGTRESSVALSPDGKRLAADQQGILKVWDVENGELVFEQNGVTAPLKFSPDSKQLVALTEDGLGLWDNQTWTHRPLFGDEKSIDTSGTLALDFSSNGRYLVFAPASRGAPVVVYDLKEHKVAATLTGLERPSVIDCDDRTVVAGGEEGHVCIWSLDSGERMGRFKAHSSIVLGLALSPDGNILATGGNDRSVLLWDVESMEQKGFLTGHRGQIWNLAFDREGHFLASASMDQSVKLWSWNEVDLDGGLLAVDEIEKRLEMAFGEGVRSNPDWDSLGKKEAKHDDRTHIIKPGDPVQAVLDAANPGDRVLFAAGDHVVPQTLNVTKPLFIAGVEVQDPDAPKSTRILGGNGMAFVMSIDTGATEPVFFQHLHIEGMASVIQHLSGDLKIASSKVSIQSALDFQSVISLEAGMLGGEAMYHVVVENSVLSAEYVGDTSEGTPPDIDIMLAGSGSAYSSMVIDGCKLVNTIPNAIANGVETRSTTARLLFQNNDVQTLGMSMVVPNHVGDIEIRNNRIHSATLGLQLGGISKNRCLIVENRMTVLKGDYSVFPLFLKDYIAKPIASCIALGKTSTGVTSGFFRKTPIGHCVGSLIERNVFEGNPRYGVALMDSPEPETFGMATPNESRDNMITNNDFTKLHADHDLALGTSTKGNQVIDNMGLKKVFREAGKEDQNIIQVSLDERRGYVHETLVSQALKGNLLGDPSERSMWVWLPPSYSASLEKRYPVVYLLHGFTGDHHSFKFHPFVHVDVGALAMDLLEQDAIEEYIIVLPDASNAYGGSFFARNEVIGDYRTYIGEELVDHIDEHFRTIQNREARRIAGISMGANGALSLALEYHQVFGAVGAMSPSATYANDPTVLDDHFAANPDTVGAPTWARNTEELTGLLSGNVSINLMFAQAAAWSPNPDNPPYFVDLPLMYPEKVVEQKVWDQWLNQDLISQIREHGNNLAATDIYFDIGVGPVTVMPEVPGIQFLQETLERKDIPYTFVESPGDHLSHLKQRTAEVLRFLSNPDSFESK